MIYGKSRNVIVVQNIDSSLIEQAILILKKDPGDKEFYASEEGIVQEAQKIIEQYQQNRHKKSKVTRKKIPLGIIIISAVVLLSCVIYFLA